MYHNAGLAEPPETGSTSSYIDAVIARDKDVSASWASQAGSTLDVECGHRSRIASPPASGSPSDPGRFYQFPFAAMSSAPDTAPWRMAAFSQAEAMGITRLEIFQIPMCSPTARPISRGTFPQTAPTWPKDAGIPRSRHWRTESPGHIRHSLGGFGDRLSNHS